MFTLTIAVFAILIACFGIIAELRQIQLTKGIQKYIMEEWEERKQTNLVEDLDAYLMEVPEGEEMTRLEAIGTVMGNRMYEATKYAGMQDKSVDARVQNRWDSQVKEAIQDKMPPQYKIIKRVAEELGFDFEDILAADEVIPFMKSLRKHGASDMFTRERESSSSW